MEKFHGIGDLGNTVTPLLFYCLFTSDNYIVYRGRGSSVGQVFLVSEICRRNVNCLPFLCLVVVGRETRLWMEKSPRVSANWVTWTRKSSSELFVTNTFMHMRQVKKINWNIHSMCHWNTKRVIRSVRIIIFKETVMHRNTSRWGAVLSHKNSTLDLTILNFKKTCFPLERCRAQRYVQVDRTGIGGRWRFQSQKRRH